VIYEKTKEKGKHRVVSKAYSMLGLRNFRELSRDCFVVL